MYFKKQMIIIFIPFKVKLNGQKIIQNEATW